MNEDPNKNNEAEDSIERILSEYSGKLSEVPEARLERLGYMLVNTESGTRIMKIAAYEAAQNEAQETFEKIPFDTLTFEFESESRTGLLHHLDYDGIRSTLRKHEILVMARDEFMNEDYPEEVQEKVYGADNKLNKIYELARKLSDKGRIPMIAGVDDPQFVVKALFADIYAGSLSDALGKNNYEEAISELEGLVYKLEEAIEDQGEYGDYYDEDSNPVGATTAKIDKQLQYLSGKFTDPDIFTPELDSQLSARCNDGDWWSEDYLDQESISNFEVIKNILETIATDLEAVELAETIRNAKSLEELHGRVNTIAPITARQAELQAGIKNKTLDPREVSRELAELKAKRKEAQTILEAIDELTRLPEQQADLVRKRISQLRSKIFGDNTDGKMKKNQFTFDAKPDAELDKDPGAVSGDCTEGKPLPFNHKGIDLHNVKVRDSKNEHVGNIYLLKTELGYNYGEDTLEIAKGRLENEKTGIEVWHLDAIQIISGAQWDNEAIKKFFDILNEAAEKKGVHGITVNTEQDHISNHRTISTPFLKWLQDNPDVVETRVVIPDVTESDVVSSFQSRGHVFFVPSKLYQPET